MILVIGSEEELHAKYIHNKLIEQGFETEYFDSRKYPAEIKINYSPSLNDGYFVINGRKIYFKDVQGVYWRWFYGIQCGNTGDNYLNYLVQRENISALDSAFNCMQNCNWVNSYEAINLHKLKTYQLYLMKQNDIRIPQTLITNDSDALIDFYNANNKRVIYKPVLGGAMTEVLKESDLTKEKLETLETAPIQLQEFIEGVDIRVFVMGDEVFGAEIKAETTDFRADKNAVITPITLPDSVQKDCRKVLSLLKLSYSGMDIKKTPQEEYVFIEANPAPMFIHFENVTKYPITQCLINLLTK